MAKSRIVLTSPAPGFPGTTDRYIELDTVLTNPSNRVLLLPDGGSAGARYYMISVPTNNWTIPSTNTAHIRLSGTSGKVIYVDWDDGSSNTYVFTGEANYVYLVHTYSNSGNFSISITGDIDHIIRENLRSVPVFWEHEPATVSLTELYLFNISEVMGDLTAGYPNLTTMGIEASPITAFGEMIVNRSNLITLNLRDSGTNTSITGELGDIGDTYGKVDLGNLSLVTGTISQLAVSATNLWYLRLSNCVSVTGNIDDAPDSIEFFIIDYNTTGSIAGSINGLPSSAQYVSLKGLSGSTTGSIMGSLPAGLTYLSLVECGNNITGTVNTNIQSSLKELIILGTVSNPLTGFGGGDFAYFNNVQRITLRYIAAQFTYSSRDWTTVPGGMAYLDFRPPATYGLSQSDLDDLIIDLSLATWTGSKQIILTGSNPAPSNTAPVNDALALLATKGVDVITN